ncbi:hypothetical protein MPH47_08675 [Psychrobacillus psychrodurans]|uniref:hypothetical protein n=1 Tax=Psychrobacillus psychrodurans TaxID=126157 RepID=UPI001F4E1CB8|nr:hypothetical protein [Psychrobacillus psychrodurans]MCK1997294.1 hypothetical protein [Psychrobacillus psychrodurans]
MNSKKIMRVGIVFILFVHILFPIKTFADWSFAFVVWEGSVYVITDERVNEVDKEIGQVTKYSDKEGTYSGNFSNSYQKGTKYFSIQGITTDKAIAIQEEVGTYIKATRDGEYAANKFGTRNISTPVFIGSILLVILLAIVGINYYGNKRME